MRPATTFVNFTYTIKAAQFFRQLGTPITLRQRYIAMEYSHGDAASIQQMAREPTHADMASVQRMAREPSHGETARG